LLALVFSVWLTLVAAAQDQPLPNAELTPGDVLSDVSVEQLCQTGYSKKARHVSEQLSRQVFAEDAIPWEKRNNYETDHLVPLSLGGSNSIRNLWPEKLRLNADGRDLGAVTKDALEERLHWLMKSGQLGLKEAQKAIATDWVAAYQDMSESQRVFRDELPIRLAPSLIGLPIVFLAGSTTGQLEANVNYLVVGALCDTYFAPYN
jgi:hypothetical protein